MTLKQLGAAVGLGDNTISQYETGKRQPKIDTLQAIAKILDVSVPYLQGISPSNELSQNSIARGLNDLYLDYYEFASAVNDYAERLGKDPSPWIHASNLADDAKGDLTDDTAREIAHSISGVSECLMPLLPLFQSILQQLGIDEVNEMFNETVAQALATAVELATRWQDNNTGLVSAAVLKKFPEYSQMVSVLEDASGSLDNYAKGRFVQQIQASTIIRTLIWLLQQTDNRINS